MPRFMRDRSGHATVTNTELFFDLVYVYAITQLSVRLVEHPTWGNAAQTALLLAMVWNVWVYTTWVTNFLDPDKRPTRLMLFAVMLGSLVMSAAIPNAFSGGDGPDRGLWIGSAYAAMQLGRTGYAVWATRGAAVHNNFIRIFSWCAVSSTLALVGGFVDGPGRGWLWLAAVAFDLLGGFSQFWTPWLGRSETSEWAVDGAHFAERCQLFVIIALGESVVAIGSPLADSKSVSALLAFSFVGAFGGAVAFFWVYFDRTAEQGVEAITASDDPGKLAAFAFHYVHPLIVAGIILSAAGDEVVLHDPGHHATGGTSWFVAGGSGLFLFGHFVYLRLIRDSASLPHLGAIAVLLVLATLGGHLTALTVGMLTLAVLVALLLIDTLTTRRHSQP